VFGMKNNGEKALFDGFFLVTLQLNNHKEIF
jgi:hypothetical protein